VKLLNDARSELFKIVGITYDSEFEGKLKTASPEQINQWCIDFQTWVINNDDSEKNNEFIRLLVDFLQVASLPRYNTCGVIVPYTTVRLDMNGKLMTYRIYPEGVSFIDIGVMAANARVARAIIGKEKGESVSIRHDSNGTLLNYKIVDIY
jgi:hypothetical protein